ncbi:DUF2683 family protein [Flavobacterium muglaense]|jgi:hypothetical protein|uniref:Uncharacterized protein n=1 Tax=Flavobacterium muglaense TaxID=2764716 RepID=A0A923SLH0_9FLAO|nr:DUF2683 family protein [Flavobacterium muglaense]MBC5839723.1 hypothetical protein [Flavobacterium muglaense]MBC5846253.1 hypothetical protein [Flavobacterium muglaense]
MEAIILHPKNKTQLSILKNLAKEMGMSFETKKEESILENIKNGLEEMQLIKKGKLKTTSAKDFLNEL